MSRSYGYGYLKAGFKHVGFTKGGLWAWQMLPADMPAVNELFKAYRMGYALAVSSTNISRT